MNENTGVPVHIPAPDPPTALPSPAVGQRWSWTNADLSLGFALKMVKTPCSSGSKRADHSAKHIFTIIYLQLNLKRTTIPEQGVSTGNIVVLLLSWLPNMQKTMYRVACKEITRRNGIQSMFLITSDGKVCVFLCKTKYRIKNTLVWKEQEEQGVWEKSEW